MRWLATKRVAIKSIVLPGNFAATKAAARIADLATSIRETDGPIQLPVVEAKTNRLIVGHDRVAALMMLKEKRIEVRFWEGSEQEFRLMQVDENLRRRHDDRPALIAERSRIESAQVSEIDTTLSVEMGTDVSVTTERVIDTPRKKAAEVNRRTAVVAGVSVAAVKKAKQRAAAKVEEASAAKVAEGDAVVADAALAAPLPDDFNSFGLKVAPEHAERLVELAQALGAWSRMTTNLLTELARVAKVANPPLLSRQAAEAIKDKAHALGHVIREAIPTSLCFYCKNDDRAVVDCPACGATGLAGRHAGDNVPPELKTQGVKARIALDGKFVPHDTIVPSKAGTPMVVSPGFRAAVKKIRVVSVDENGTETDVPLEDDAEELAF